MIQTKKTISYEKNRYHITLITLCISRFIPPKI